MKVDINLGKKIQNKAIVKNIGKIITGDIHNPCVEGDAIQIKNGKIAKVGFVEENEEADADHIIDANGMTVCPGLIDSHAHFEVNDYNVAFRKLGWMEDSFRGGVTTMIDQGCVGLIKGRPINPEGAKALSILLRECHKLYRAGGGLKAHGGAIVLVRGFVESDFKELASRGIFVIAEIGGGGLYLYEDIRKMIKSARKYGIKISQHFGAAAIPGGATQLSKDVLKIKPDIVVHANGGPVAPPWDDIKKVIDGSDSFIEVVFNGNEKIMIQIVKYLAKKNQLHRLMVGTDSPVGLGTQSPFGVLRTIVSISAFANLPAEKALALATGNTAKAYGLNTGLLEVGREADLLILNEPFDSAAKDASEAIELGDIPAEPMIMVDGQVILLKFFPYSRKVVKIDGIEKMPRTLEEFRAGIHSNVPKEQDGSYTGTIFKPFGKPKYP